jgi:GNAT superfamily N-acetyltransferase
MIRPATRKDEEAVFRLAEQLANKFVIERAAFANSFTKLIEAKDVYLHVVEDAGEIVAYLLGWSRVAFYSNGPVTWIQEIVVHPDHRRSGIGRLLMAHFEQWSADRKTRVISLATAGAKDFYEALGYVASATYYKKIIPPAKSD